MTAEDEQNQIIMLDRDQQCRYPAGIDGTPEEIEKAERVFYERCNECAHVLVRIRDNMVVAGFRDERLDTLFEDYRNSGGDGEAIEFVFRPGPTTLKNVARYYAAKLPSSQAERIETRRDNDAKPFRG